MPMPAQIETAVAATSADRCRRQNVPANRSEAVMKRTGFESFLTNGMLRSITEIGYFLLYKKMIWTGGHRHRTTSPLRLSQDPFPLIERIPARRIAVSPTAKRKKFASSSSNLSIMTEAVAWVNVILYLR